MLTEKYYEMQTLLAERNQAYVMLAVIALALVGAWLMIDYTVPAQWRGRVKKVYMVGGVVLYLFTILVVNPFGMN